MLILCFISLFITGCIASNPTEDENNGNIKNDSKKNNTSSEKNSYVSYNGKLKVNGVDLVNQYNKKIEEILKAKEQELLTV